MPWERGPRMTILAAFPLPRPDTIDEMHAVYNRYKGHTALSVDPSGWRLVK